MMRTVALLLLLYVCDIHALRFRQHRPRNPSLISSGETRVSPTSGVRIALPSKYLPLHTACSQRSSFASLAAEQLAWQAQELGVLVCFNMATYLDVDGCTGQMVPNVSLFNPSELNTDNWAQTMLDFGAQYAVLVAKVMYIERKKRDDA